MLSEATHDAAVTAVFVLVELTAIVAALATETELVMTVMPTHIVVLAMTRTVGLMQGGGGLTSDHQHEQQKTPPQHALGGAQVSLG